MLQIFTIFQLFTQQHKSKSLEFCEKYTLLAALNLTEAFTNLLWQDFISALIGEINEAV